MDTLGIRICIYVCMYIHIVYMNTGLGGWLLKTDLFDWPPTSEVQSLIPALSARDSARNIGPDAIDAVSYSERELSPELHYSGVSRRGLFSKAIRLGLYTCILFVCIHT